LGVRARARIVERFAVARMIEETERAITDCLKR